MEFTQPLRSKWNIYLDTSPHLPKLGQKQTGKNKTKHQNETPKLSPQNNKAWKTKKEQVPPRNLTNWYQKWPYLKGTTFSKPSFLGVSMLVCWVCNRSPALFELHRWEFTLSVDGAGGREGKGCWGDFLYLEIEGTHLVNMAGWNITIFSGGSRSSENGPIFQSATLLSKYVSLVTDNTLITLGNHGDFFGTWKGNWESPERPNIFRTNRVPNLIQVNFTRHKNIQKKIEDWTWLFKGIQHPVQSVFLLWQTTKNRSSSFRDVDPTGHPLLQQKWFVGRCCASYRSSAMCSQSSLRRPSLWLNIVLMIFLSPLKFQPRYFYSCFFLGGVGVATLCPVTVTTRHQEYFLILSRGSRSL